MMTKRRLVVTGIGVVSCLGHEHETFYQNLLNGRSGICTISSFPIDGYPTQIAGEIKDFSPAGYMDKKLARRADRCIQYCLVAGKKAFQDARLDLGSLDKERCGIIIGSGIGGMSFYTDNVQAMLEKGIHRISPFFVPYILTNMPGGLLSVELGFMGPNYSISTACATGTHSIISAANHLLKGEADLMLCGGVEAAVCPTGLGGFIACKALSSRNAEPTKASRPWDKGRDGFVLGEGAGILVLEEMGHARSRGAKILAEYVGGGVSCDAYHMTDPRTDGLGITLCVRHALADGNVSPEEVNYINAHATSTPAGDMVEIEALKQIFTENRSQISINSTKSMIGHALGAAGGLEAIATVKAIETGKIHPTLNLEDPDEGLDFQAPRQAEEKEVRVAISNSFGFGGHNACLVFRSVT
jgi:3-oxoacyl-[acyl-carrier-protein] synthase II